MPLHEILRDLIGDPLVAQGLDQPVEQRGCIMVANRGSNAFGLEGSPGVGEK
jgi:hypothetical protein